MAAAAYAQHGVRWQGNGASIVGGCCGTRPGHIAALASALNPGAPASI